MEAEQADALVHQVVSDWRTAGLQPADHQLCAFAAKLTTQQYKMVPEDLDSLRSFGFSDRALHDAVQVIGYFNYISRIADSLGVEAEENIKKWGPEKR
ncbi:MAG: hypothetical protein MK106_11015 [Mariniblastus sp.]|nr:hypothetical protein [Mariniblastus sp.]